MFKSVQGTQDFKKNEFRDWGLSPLLSFLFLNITYMDDKAGDVRLASILLWTLCFPLAGKK